MSETPITQLLQHWQRGEAAALNELLERVYGNLSKIGRNLVRQENRFQTLQTQDLIHEAFLRFSEIKQLDWKNRQHFFSVWASIMRRVLIDRARAGDSKKRSGSLYAVTFDDSKIAEPVLEVDVLVLSEALDKLQAYNEELRQIVEMRYFLGCTVNEIAQVMDISDASVKRKWSLAQAWLYRYMNEQYQQ